jgi:hypothetical protein
MKLYGAVEIQLHINLGTRCKFVVSFMAHPFNRSPSVWTLWRGEISVALVGKLKPNFLAIKPIAHSCTNCATSSVLDGGGGGSSRPGQSSLAGSCQHGNRPWVLYNTGKFLSGWATISFWRTYLLGVDWPVDNMFIVYACQLERWLQSHDQKVEWPHHCGVSSTAHMVTNSMEQSPFCEANSCSAAQEFPSVV